MDGKAFAEDAIPLAEKSAGQERAEGVGIVMRSRLGAHTATNQLLVARSMARISSFLRKFATGAKKKRQSTEPGPLRIAEIERLGFPVQ